MEVVIGYEVLIGIGNDPIIKDISIGAKNVSQSFIFKVLAKCTILAMPKMV
jgi:hypothetical protein